MTDKRVKNGTKAIFREMTNLIDEILNGENGIFRQLESAGVDLEEVNEILTEETGEGLGVEMNAGDMVQKVFAFNHQQCFTEQLCKEIGERYGKRFYFTYEPERKDETYENEVWRDDD